MNKKTYMTPVEVENEMEARREKLGFTGITEREVIKNVVKMAKANSRIGDKVMMVISPDYVHIPVWQREMTVENALDIGTNYNTHKWEVPKVIVKDWKLYVVDGQHRVYGAFKGNKEEIVVEYVELSEKEAIDIFLSQSKDRKTMRPADMYKAAIVAGTEEWVRFRDICKANNVAIKCDMELVPNPVGVFTSVSDGVKLARTNPELLDKILKLITKLQWNGSDVATSGAYGAKVIRSVKKLYAFYEGKEDRMEDILLRNCKGYEFYATQLVWRPMETLLDYLSRIVEREIDIETIAIPTEKKRNGKKIA